MDKKDLLKSKVGDFAQTYMNKVGEINSRPDDYEKKTLIFREFEILAIAGDNKSEYSYALCLYNDEQLFEAEYIKDISSFLDNLIVGKSKDIDKYKNKYGRWLTNPKVFSIKSMGPDGCFCKVCHEFYNMAVPNQTDNTLICWSCRQNPMRAYY